MVDFLLTDTDGSAASLDFGVLFAGTSPSPRALRVKNTSGATLTDCRVVVTNRVTQAADGPFVSLSQSGDANPIADVSTDGNAITFTEGSTTGLVNLLIDDAGPDVYDEDDIVIHGGIDLSADGITQYRIADSDPFQGLVFAIKESVTEESTGILYVSDGGDCTLLVDSDDNEVSGPSGIVLTQSGQSAGTILNNGEVEFSLSINPSLSKTVLLNPRSFSFRLLGTKGGAATQLEIVGTFIIAQFNAAFLAWRISVAQPSYPLLHYDVEATVSSVGLYVEDSENPGIYALDSRQHYDANGTRNTRGLYIEDPENPGELILDTTTRYDVETTVNSEGSYIQSSTHPWAVTVDTGSGEGHYPGWAEVLAANGMTFVGS